MSTEVETDTAEELKREVETEHSQEDDLEGDGEQTAGNKDELHGGSVPTNYC